MGQPSGMRRLEDYQPSQIRNRTLLFVFRNVKSYIDFLFSPIYQLTFELISLNSFSFVPLPQKMSFSRTGQLRELKDIIEEISRAIMWVNEREEEELVFDWGVKNIDVYVPKKQESYSVRPRARADALTHTGGLVPLSMFCHFCDLRLNRGLLADLLLSSAERDLKALFTMLVTTVCDTCDK